MLFTKMARKVMGYISLASYFLFPLFSFHFFPLFSLPPFCHFSSSSLPSCLYSVLSHFPSWLVICVFLLVSFSSSSIRYFSSFLPAFPPFFTLSLFTWTSLSSTDVGARNNRRFCAVNYNKTPGFEVTQDCNWTILLGILLWTKIVVYYLKNLGARFSKLSLLFFKTFKFNRYPETAPGMM